MYVSLDLLLDGSANRATDWLVAGALATKISFQRLKAATLYVRIQSNVQEIAKYIHKRKSAVRESLERLQGQERIQIVTRPGRGRNCLIVNIGLDKKGKNGTKVLFAPTLSPGRIFKMSMENCKKAKTDEDKHKYLQYARDALIRVKEGVDIDKRTKDAWMDKLERRIKELAKEEETTPTGHLDNETIRAGHYNDPYGPPNGPMGRPSFNTPKSVQATTEPPCTNEQTEKLVQAEKPSVASLRSAATPLRSLPQAMGGDADASVLLPD